MEHMVSNPACNKQMVEKSRGGTSSGRPPHQPEQLNCPRCNSTNTKFCYYNNYSLTQPRYFCKTCRRYWTEGGSLRNVPVGGGSRKNKRPSSSLTTSSSSPKLPDLNPPTYHHDHFQNPKITQNKGQDLNLAFPPLMLDYPHGSVSQYLFQMPKIENSNIITINSTSSSSSTPTTTTNPITTSALDLLRSGINDQSRVLGTTFLPAVSEMNPVMYSSSSTPGLNNSLHDNYKQTLSFSIDHPDHGYGSDKGATSIHDPQESSNNGGRVLLPFGEMRNISSTCTNNNNTTEVDNKEQGAFNGFWNGMLGNGGPW